MHSISTRWILGIKVICLLWMWFERQTLTKSIILYEDQECIIYWFWKCLNNSTNPFKLKFTLNIIFWVCLSKRIVFITLNFATRSSFEFGARVWPYTRTVEAVTKLSYQEGHPFWRKSQGFLPVSYLSPLLAQKHWGLREKSIVATFIINKDQHYVTGSKLEGRVCTV